MKHARILIASEDPDAARGLFQPLSETESYHFEFSFTLPRGPFEKPWPDLIILVPTSDLSRPALDWMAEWSSVHIPILLLWPEDQCQVSPSECFRKALPLATGILPRSFSASATALILQSTLERSSQLLAEREKESKRVQCEIQQSTEALERRVAERTRMLESTKRELDAFSYSVAHDLRSPLRSMHGFASLLLSSPTLKLDAENQEFLDAICQNALRMDRMIAEYLRLAKIGQGAMTHISVNMDQTLRAAWEEVTRNSPPPHPDLQSVPLPPTLGDPSLLQQVWFNLLSNAVKFTRNSTRPLIEVGCDTSGSTLRYWVRDNGVGFKSEQAARLFIPFRRLHDAAEFPGEGIGLSLIQRIIQKHGGTVQAQGVEGQGACFSFSLPKPPSPHRPQLDLVHSAQWA